MTISKEIRAEIESYRLLSATQLVMQIEIKLQPRYQDHYIVDFVVWLWNKFRESAPELEQAKASIQIAFPEAKRAARYLSELQLKLRTKSAFCDQLKHINELPFEEKVLAITPFVREYEPRRYYYRISPILVAIYILTCDPRIFGGCSDK